MSFALGGLANHVFGGGISQNWSELVHLELRRHLVPADKYGLQQPQTKLLENPSDTKLGYFERLAKVSRLADAEVKRKDTSKGGEMTEGKRAELYTSPGGKFIRVDTLPRILAPWRSIRSEQKQSTSSSTTGSFTLAKRSTS